MKLDTQFTDPLRRFWIDDNLPNWDVQKGTLSYKVYHNCCIKSNGQICEEQFRGNQKAIFLGHFLNIWGHCITDNLKKLWFLSTEQGMEYRKQGYILVCTVWKNKVLAPNFIKLLEYLNIDASQIKIVDETDIFEQLIVPDSSLDDGHRYYKEYKAVVDTIRDKIPIDPSMPKKVYFSRSRLGSGRDFGEVYVEAVFRKLGYSIIYPETIPLAKQLVVLRSCESFAATEGSISHNVLFCQDGVECIIIRKSVTLNGYQFTANKIREVSAIYIDAHLSLFRIFQDSFGPFFLYVNQNVVEFAKTRGVEIEIKFPHIKFFEYCLKTIYFAIRYRTKPLLIRRDPDFYWKRLKEDF